MSRIQDVRNFHARMYVGDCLPHLGHKSKCLFASGDNVRPVCWGKGAVDLGCSCEDKKKCTFLSSSTLSNFKVSRTLLFRWKIAESKQLGVSGVEFRQNFSSAQIEIYCKNLKSKPQWMIQRYCFNFMPLFILLVGWGGVVSMTVPLYFTWTWFACQRDFHPFLFFNQIHRTAI